MNSLYPKFIIPAICLLLGGCAGFTKRDPYTTVEIPEDKFTHIDPIDLDAMNVDSTKPAPPAPLTQELSLEQVRAITLENNLELKVELINPEIADQQTASVEARKFEVAFGAGIEYSATDNTGPLIDETQRTDINVGLSAPLPTGGRIGLDLTDIETRIDNTNSLYSTPFSFSVSQPLLKGAGRREFMHEIRVSRYGNQKVQADTKLRMIEVIVAADKAYWNLYKKQKVLEVRRQQYELAERQLEQARRFVEAGQSPQVELLRAEAGLAGQLSNIIAAENDVRQSQRRLKYIMNKPELPVSGSTALIPKTEVDPTHYQLDHQKLVTHALDNRMEMIKLALDMASNTSMINHYKNARLPDISLAYRYGLGTGDPNRNDAYDQLLHRDSEQHTVGLNLSYPLGRRAAKADLAGAKLRQAQLQELKSNRAALIRQEVYNALDGLETSWQQILANRQSAIVEGRLFEAEQRQFEISMRTSTDVLEAQARFSDSQSAEYEALANYQIALLELARSTGTLLGAAKVE